MLNKAFRAPYLFLFLFHGLCIRHAPGRDPGLARDP